MNYTNIILICWIVLFALDFFTEWLLDILNINTIIRNRNEVPGNFSGFINAETYRKSHEYSLRKAHFGLFTSVQGRVFIILILAFQLTGFLDNLISRWALPAYWHGLLFLMAGSLALGLVRLPTTLYSRFIIEEEFGFNTTGMKTFLFDLMKSSIVGFLLVLALLAGLYMALALAGEYWWLGSWLFVTIFQFILTILYPLVIAPLFNKFEMLPPGDLRIRLEELANRCGFAVKGIYVMDGSRRSRHSNAYFTGIGRFRRIVIFDTLIESLTADELEAVLAHEIGHWKHGHIRQRLLIGIVINFAVFIAAGWALEWEPLFRAFGFNRVSLHGLIVVLTFFSAPITAFFSPLINGWMRKHEYQADSYAARQTGSSKTLSDALITLSCDNLSNLTPHPAYSFWHYSHPSLAERLKALASLA